MQTASGTDKSAQALNRVSSDFTDDAQLLQHPAPGGGSDNGQTGGRGWAGCVCSWRCGPNPVACCCQHLHDKNTPHSDDQTRVTAAPSYKKDSLGSGSY